jgi:hypothetical protein
MLIQIVTTLTLVHSKLTFFTGACGHMGIHLLKAQLIACQNCTSFILTMSEKNGNLFRFADQEQPTFPYRTESKS